MNKYVTGIFHSVSTFLHSRAESREQNTASKSFRNYCFLLKKYMARLITKTGPKERKKIIILKSVAPNNRDFYKNTYESKDMCQLK